ncbi:lysophospholipid acyltransferase family protein [Halanaerobium hydrogeniformans]|uniref:1-acyl-sn-glycerol-3-phosphate acyltransferase n=1 Tax=Halanaerobium hydrogeniformans TaxID=656519 RepID=E4RLQ6_HALHG|nr:lysophospholipid acyltransferase family protein [Halanaerobium hydrogeniformans]ADQ14970.1 1-acyl-sn-glycerol-3-phosphate acyltransferase [Halanaerobium hydrogeniformans]
MRKFLYKLISKIIYFIFRVFFRAKVSGQENLPQEGGVIIMSNHISLLDPPLIASVLNRPVHFMAKKELFENPILKVILYIADAFPVDRDSTDIKAVKKALNILKNDEVLGLFPEGTRGDESEVADLKDGSVMLAVRSRVPIVPVGIKNIKSKGRITINIGEAFTMEDFPKKHLSDQQQKEAAQYIKEKIVKLVNS